MRATQEAPGLNGNFVLLKAGRLQVLLPRGDVGTVEYLSTVPTPTGQAGLFELPADNAGGTRCVAALSPQMRLLERSPAGRFLLTSFPSRPDVSLCWDEVKVLIDLDIVPRVLPTAMLGPGAPFTEYVALGDGLAFLCNAERLIAHAFSARS